MIPVQKRSLPYGHASRGAVFFQGEEKNGLD